MCIFFPKRSLEHYDFNYQMLLISYYAKLTKSALASTSAKNRSSLDISSSAVESGKSKPSGRAGRRLLAAPW